MVGGCSHHTHRSGLLLFSLLGPSEIKQPIPLFLTFGGDKVSIRRTDKRNLSCHGSGQPLKGIPCGKELVGAALPFLSLFPAWLEARGLQPPPLDSLPQSEKQPTLCDLLEFSSILDDTVCQGHWSLVPCLGKSHELHFPRNEDCLMELTKLSWTKKKMMSVKHGACALVE